MASNASVARAKIAGGPDGLEIVIPANRNLALGLAGFMGGVIAFECEGRTIRFAASLDEAEAHTIVERMRLRYGFPDAAVGGRVSS
jgi:hypothetical protein